MAKKRALRAEKGGDSEKGALAEKLMVGGC